MKTPCTTVLSKKAFDVLIDGLGVDDPIIQADSARLLGESGCQQAMGPLVDYVIACPYYEKTAGLEALRRLGRAEVCPQIAALIQSPNVYEDYYWIGAETVRAATALTLLALAPDRDTGYFERGYASADCSKMVVFSHYYAPVIMALPDAHIRIIWLKQWVREQILRKNIFRPDQMVVISKALGSMGDGAAIDQLKWFLRFPSRYVRGEALFQLIKAAPTAEHLLLAERLHTEDPADYVQLKSAAALCLAGRPSYADFLRTVVRAEQDAFVKAVAIELLAMVGRREDIILFETALRDVDAYVRLCAVEALEAFGKASLSQVMDVFETDAHPRVRLQAAKTLLSLMPEDRP